MVVSLNVIYIYNAGLIPSSFNTLIIDFGLLIAVISRYEQRDVSRSETKNDETKDAKNAEFVIKSDPAAFPSGAGVGFTHRA